jgi:FkbM family methyltransferase
MKNPFINLGKQLPPLRYPIIIYGAGIVGQTLLDTIGIKKVVFFVDKHKKGSMKGVPIHGLDHLTHDYPIVIASIIWEREIYHQLLDSGFKPYPYTFLNYLYPETYNYHHYTDLNRSLKDTKGISSARALWKDKESLHIFDTILKFRKQFYFDVPMDSILSKDPQYFIPELRLNNREVFVDCGSYSITGSSIIDFFHHAKGKVYAFELDNKNYRKLLSRVKKHKDVHIYNIGVYKRNGEMPAFVNGETESRLVNYEKTVLYPIRKETKKYTVRVVALDEFLPEIPTFIKMDIEGSEYDALLGLRKTIRIHKPKLAICVYHKPTDLWKIPLLIHEMNPSYRFYLRHHSQELIETVMYAV